MRFFEITNRRLVLLATLVALVWSVIFVERALTLLAERQSTIQPADPTPVVQPVAPARPSFPARARSGGVAIS